MVAAYQYEGRRFERLVVERRDGSDAQRRVVWLCRCDCGGSVRVNSSDLRRGRTRSCGCLVLEALAKIDRSRNTFSPCKALGCDLPSREGDWCPTHSRRVHRHGNPYVFLTDQERIERSRQGWANRRAAA